MITLYDYQATWVADIARELRTHQAVLAVMPTGGGKTVCFSNMAWRMERNGKRVWILCHRKELMRQISDSLHDFGVYHGLVNGAHKPDMAARVQVGTIGTIVGRTHLYPAPDYIIMDESHHAVADSWRAVLSRFPAAKIIGVTATPVRGDGVGLGRHVGGIFDSMVIGPSFKELVEMGKLARPRHFRSQRHLDFSGIGTVAGDYNSKQMSKMMNDRTITGDTIGLYRQHIDGARMIVSCCDIQHAESVAAMFNENGIEAGFVSGKQRDQDRDAVLEDFQTARVKVLTFCDIVSEGFDLKENRFPDVPPLLGVACLRKTKSLGLCLQIWGRGSRKTPKKNEFFIFDQVDNYMIHGAPWADRHWSLDGETKQTKKKTEDEATALKQCERCKESYEPQPTCPYCGHTKATQTVKTASGQLIEVPYGTQGNAPTKAEIKEKQEAAKRERVERVAETLAVAANGAERERLVMELVRTAKSGSDLDAIATAWGLEGKTKSSKIYGWSKQFNIKFR